METLKWPQAAVSTEFAGCAKLNDIILRLEEAARREGKVVCRIKINGLSLDEADETRFATTGLDEIHDIEVELQRVEDLVRETAESLREFVIEVREACLDAAEMFRGGVTPEATKLFNDIVRGTQWLTEALLAIKTNWAHSTPKAGLNADWAANETHMMASVRELMQGYQSQDFVLVADVLEYELSTSLEQWLKILDLTAIS